MADVKMINGFTGTIMYVPEERADEYKAAGHIPAAVPEEPKKRKKKE